MITTKRHRVLAFVAAHILFAALLVAVSTAYGETTFNMDNYPASQNGCTITGTVTASGGGVEDKGYITSPSQISAWDITITPPSGSVVILTNANSYVSLNYTAAAVADDPGIGGDPICLETLASSSELTWSYDDTNDPALQYFSADGHLADCVYAAYRDGWTELFGEFGGNISGPGQIGQVGGGEGNLLIASTGPVPEPGTLTLLVSALLGLAGAGYLRRRAKA